MPRTMKLIPFAEFTAAERDALLAVLGRLHVARARVCVTRVEPAVVQGDSAAPSTVLVSAPGWWRAYQGTDWIASLERDLVGRAAAPAH